MKKINRFFVAAMVCIAAVACSKEQSNEIPGANTGATEETIPENYIELTFYTPNMDVKTSVEGQTVSWTEGDRIRICWEGGSIVSNEVAFEEGTAYFTAMVSPDATDFYAVYPSTIEAAVTEGNFSITIPSSQSGRFADADIIVAKTTKEELTYAFHHAVSLVKFVISEENERSISRAQFVDLANNSQLTGAMTIAFDEQNGIASSTVSEDTTLDVIDVTAVQPGDNYMAVIPAKELAGFGLRLGSESKWYTGLVGENPVTVGERLNLKEVDTKIHDGDFYIKVDGEGKGTSWEDAGDAELLQSLIGDYDAADGDKSLARAWRVNGKTIKVAEGNYISVGNGKSGVNGFSARYTVDEPLTFKIEGGYTSSGEKSASAKTVFGPESGTVDGNRAFFFCGEKVNVTLENLYISNHTRTSSAGGGAIYNAKQANLTLNSCHFDNNKTDNDRAGGAILSEGTTVINKSNFSGNTAATNGGAISMTNGATLTIANSNFSGNSAINGGAIYMNGEATHTIANSNFSGNNATTGDGGVFCITISSSIRADKCKFLDNYANAKNTSGVIGIIQEKESDSSKSAWFNSCEFRGNHVNGRTNGGAIIYTLSNNSSLAFNNCTLLNNNSVATSFFIYTTAPCIMSNSTFIDESLTATNSSLLYFGKASATDNTAVNNIIINKNQSYYGPRKDAGKLTTSYNIYSKPFSEFTSDTDVIHIYELPNGNATINDDGMSYYSWSGSVEGFLYTTKTNVANIIKANTVFGQDFYNWLTSLDYGNGLNALDVDIRGVARTNDVWPGSYQN